MPRKMNDKHRSIFVKFHQEVTEKEVVKKLASMGVSGSKVSSLINRWVVDVPFWKEEEYQEVLGSDELVEIVHENFDRRRKPAAEESEYES
jgi:hypothetical protein